MVYYGSHPADHLTSLLVKRHIIFRLAEFERGILVLAQRIHIVAEKIGGIIFTTFIKVVMEINKLLQVFLRLYFSYFY